MKKTTPILIAALCVALLLGSCSASPAPSSRAAANTAEEYAHTPNPPSLPQAEAYTYDGAQASESALPLPLLKPSDNPGKKIVYTVSLSLQTTDFDTGTRKVLTTAAEMGGYVQSATVNGRNMRNPNTERKAVYTLRVPSERLADFLVVMEDSFTLWQLQQDSQDITAKRQQTDTRLLDLYDQAERLADAIAEETDSRQKLAFERELASVQASIASFEATATVMDDDAIYSTVTVSLFEVIFAEPVQPVVLTYNQRFNAALQNSIEGFVGFWQNALLFLIAAAPSLIVVGVGVAIVIAVRRLLRKRGANPDKTTFDTKEKQP